MPEMGGAAEVIDMLQGLGQEELAEIRDEIDALMVGEEEDEMDLEEMDMDFEDEEEE
jgi:hypothetical protein